MQVRLGRVASLVTAITVPIAVGLLIWSWVSQASTWESGVFVQFGSTLLLFVPLAVLAHSIETGIDSVREQQVQISARQEQTASDVARLTEEVAQTQADLRFTREQLSEIARDRIAQTRDRDSELFQTVGEEPSRATVLDALVRAQKMGIIADLGCRVDLFGIGYYLRFQPEWESNDPIITGSQDPDTIQLTIETMSASPLKQLRWASESNASDITVEIAEAMQASGTYPGDNLFDAGKLFADLSALLALGHDQATTGRVDPVRKIIQLCPPQWAVCDDGIYSTGVPYQIVAWKLKQDDLIPHMSEKIWVDMDSLHNALDICQALYRSDALAVKPERP